MEYQVTLYTQAQITLTIKDPKDAEGAALRAIKHACDKVPASVETGIMNFGNPVRMSVETGDWRILEVTDEEGYEVV